MNKAWSSCEIRRRRGGNPRVVWCAPIVAALAVLWAGPVAAQHVYWVDSFTDQVLRAGREIPEEETAETRTDVEELVATDMKRPFGLAVDAAGGKVYWTDYGTGTIRRANLDGSAVEGLISTAALPSGIALDVPAGKMYWADVGLHEIRRADLDGSNEQIVVSGVGIGVAVAVAVHSGAGQVYWTDIKQQAIKRANFDGTGMETLVSGAVNTPTALQLDLSAGKMYWADSRKDMIARANLDGTSFEELIKIIVPIVGGIALDVDAGMIYWTDVQFTRIRRANMDIPPGSTPSSRSDVENLLANEVCSPLPCPPRLLAPQGIVVVPGSGP